ncbi:MAG: methyltransferase domain-containing protein, partial [Promethearchaeota archaeon]
MENWVIVYSKELKIRTSKKGTKLVEEKNLDEHEIRKFVREEYGRIGSGPTTNTQASSCCGPTADVEIPTSSCCAPSITTENQSLNSCSTNSCAPIRIPADKLDEFREKYGAFLGYTNEELESVPEGANLSLGCGNPTALASIKEGETVVDLGAGGGFDCFLAANKVGSTGKVIGVDMTPPMIDRARENKKKGAYEH